MDRVSVDGERWTAGEVDTLHTGRFALAVKVQVKVLDALTHLTPEAAQHLATWGGSSLSLDGLTSLDPDAAAQLAMWPTADTLSLDGLTEVSLETAQQLAAFKGAYIYLRNLPQASLQPDVLDAIRGYGGLLLFQ